MKSPALKKTMVYLASSQSRTSKNSKESRVSRQDALMSSVKRLRQQNLSNSKLSVHSFSPSYLTTQSPSKVKTNKYEQLKFQIQQKIHPKIDGQHIQRIIVNDGSKYVGTLQNGKREGFGIIYFKQGDVYGGEWRNDQMQGHGMYLFRNCDFYVGDIEKGLKQGQGRYFYSKGNCYEGHWRNDKKDGFGVMISSDQQEKYEGNWVNGLKQGFGVEKWKNGDQFQGTFSKGVKSGKGTLTKHDGLKASGHWYNDRISGVVSINFKSQFAFTGQVQQIENEIILHGKGTDISPDGVIYEGSYQNNKRHGHCEITYPNGDHYWGQIVQNKFEGEGTYFYKSLNCTYRGQWKNGLQNGRGITQFENKTILQAEWTQGKPGGQGKIKYLNGDVYEGEINRQGRNGYGIYFKGNGERIEGYFKNGLLISRKND